MMPTKGGLSSPMRSGFNAPSLRGKGNPGVYDHHTTPALSKPRDVGKDAVPTIFFTDVSYKTMKPSLTQSLRGGTAIKGK
jgi:hypothetical protein